MSHSRMSTPYVLYTFGNINNFLENFTVGIASKENYFKSWTPIIPDSNLIVVPPIDNRDWKLLQNIKPSKAMNVIIISVLITLFILGVCIMI